MTDEAAAAGGGRYFGEGLIPDVAADTIVEMLHGRGAQTSVSAAAAAGGADPRTIRAQRARISPGDQRTTKRQQQRQRDSQDVKIASKLA